MIKNLSIFKNTSWLTISRITGDLISLVYFIVLSREFGESGIGNYAFAFAVAAFCGLGVELGLRPLITREVAKEPENAAKYIWNIAILQIALAVFIGSCLYLWSIILNNDEVLRLFILFAFFSVALKSIGLSFVGSLEGIDKMRNSALLLLTERATTTAIGLVLIYCNYSLEIVITSNIIGGFIYALFSFLLVKRYSGKIRFGVDINLIKKIFVSSLPFLGASILNVIYSRVDILMIHYFKNETETGAYSVAFRCIESSLVLPLMLGLAIYPTLSRAYKKNSDEMESIFYNSIKWLGMIGFLGAALIAVSGDKLIIFIFGSKFVKSGSLIQYMAALFFIGSIKVAFWRLLFACNKEIDQLRANMISISINVLLNFIMIPLYGAFGAVWASIISETILLFLFYKACNKIIKNLKIKSWLKFSLINLSILAFGIGLRGYVPWPFLFILITIIILVVSYRFKIIKIKNGILVNQ